MASSYETTCYFIWTMLWGFIELIYFTPEDRSLVWQHWEIPGCWLIHIIFYFFIWSYSNIWGKFSTTIKQSLSSMFTDSHSLLTFLFSRALDMYSPWSPIFSLGNQVSLHNGARTIPFLPNRTKQENLNMLSYDQVQMNPNQF